MVTRLALWLLAAAVGIGLMVWLLPPRAIERRLLEANADAVHGSGAGAEAGVGAGDLPDLGTVLAGWQADRRLALTITSEGRAAASTQQASQSPTAQLAAGGRPPGFR